MRPLDGGSGLQFKDPSKQGTSSIDFSDLASGVAQSHFLPFLPSVKSHLQVHENSRGRDVNHTSVWKE